MTQPEQHLAEHGPDTCAHYSSCVLDYLVYCDCGKAMRDHCCHKCCLDCGVDENGRAFGE